jgi:ribosome recycling factor
MVFNQTSQEQTHIMQAAVPVQVTKMTSIYQGRIKAALAVVETVSIDRVGKMAPTASVAVVVVEQTLPAATVVQAL